MPLLHAGDAFPDLTITLPGGDLVSVPAWFAGGYGVVLFSRGASCRACVEQERAFQRSTARFEKAGISVVAVSSDDEATTSELISKYGLTYPVGHSADPQSISDATGAFVSLDPPQLQSTGFVLDPSGNVIISLYSCGAIGQLLPDDVLELVRDLHVNAHRLTSRSEDVRRTRAQGWRRLWRTRARLR